jgi:hypothetical protein
LGSKKKRPIHYFDDRWVPLRQMGLWHIKRDFHKMKLRACKKKKAISPIQECDHRAVFTSQKFILFRWCSFISYFDAQQW